MLIWWARQDSNLRPIGYEPTALPLSYEPLKQDIILYCNLVVNMLSTPCYSNSTDKLLPFSWNKLEHVLELWWEIALCPASA